MSVIRLNIEAAILQSLAELIEEQNVAGEMEPDAPRVHSTTTADDLVRAAEVMAQAFVRNRDKAWIAWLRPADVKRIGSGDFADAERKIARVILYLLQAALRAGGVVVLETTRDERQGGRTVRGAALRTLPSVAAPGAGLLHELTVSAPTALRAYGLRRTLAAQGASIALQRATHAMRVREGIPARCI